MLFESLKEIEKAVEVDESISYGASYFIAVENLKINISDIDSLKDVFIRLEVDINENSVSPSEIDDRSADFTSINDIWHFKDNIAAKFMNIIREADAYYRPLDTDGYYSRGNVNDIFRIVKKGSEFVLIEFYACD